MNYNEALKHLNQGGCVRRLNWNNDKNIDAYIKIVKTISHTNFGINIISINLESMFDKPILAFVNSLETQIGWVPSEEDILSNDWVLINE